LKKGSFDAQSSGFIRALSWKALVPFSSTCRRFHFPFCVHLLLGHFGLPSALQDDSRLTKWKVLSLIFCPGSPRSIIVAQTWCDLWWARACAVVPHIDALRTRKKITQFSCSDGSRIMMRSVLSIAAVNLVLIGHLPVDSRVQKDSIEVIQCRWIKPHLIAISSRSDFLKLPTGTTKYCIVRVS
jgi:hypothetical protein